MIFKDSGFQLKNPEYYKRILMKCSIEKEKSKF